MDAQTCVNKLCEHLLGKNRYISDPVSGTQANDIIYEEICRKFPGDNDSLKDKYRRRHPKCKFCHYVKYYIANGEVLAECTVTEKLVNDGFPRYLCSAFELKKEKKENA